MKRLRGKLVTKTSSKRKTGLHIASRFSKPQAIIFSLIFAALGCYVIHMSFAATVTCDLNATTSNFSSQLNATQPGQTLCLATGSYGTFTGVAKASPGVTITAASGATPNMVVDFRTPSPAIAWLTLDNLTIKGGDIAGPSHDIKISNSTITKEFNFWQAGGVQNNACSNCSAMINSNIIMDHDTFNLADSASGPGLYEGRLTFVGPTSGNTGVTVKNSIFRDNCADGIMFAEGGEGVTIGPGNEFTNLNQNLESPSVITGDCSPHVDSIQLGTTGRPVITGNYFHNDSTGITSYDWENSAIVTDNIFSDVGQDAILAGGYDSNSVIEHNTIRGGTLYCATTHQNDYCMATIRNNVTDELTIQTGSSPTVNDYNLCKFACSGGTHNVTGSPTFSGGSAPSTLAGFVLASGSLGKGAASDGKDMGATYFGGSVCDLNATTSNFSSQVTAATAGQTICLASGNYGTWTGTNKAVTITEQTNATATISLNIGQGDGNFTIDGLTIGDSNISGDSNNYANSNNPKNITIKNSAFTGPMNIEYLTNSNILLDNNTHININSCDSGCRPAAVQLSYSSDVFSGVTVQNSLFQGGNADGIQTGAGLNIINNKFIDISEHGNDNLHTDPIQLIGAKGSVVRGNYLYNTSDGIVAYDGLDSALIENNVLDLVNGRWGIELYSDKNSIVRHNTLKYGTGCSYAACGVITVDHKSTDPAGTGTQIYDNIASVISANSGSVISRQDHNMLHSGASGSDINGVPTYTGGANPTTYSGFALATGSPGKGAASDGQDIGISGSGGATGGGSGDTTAPTVSLTAPTSGATVSGASVSISATAADNTGVAGVQFKLDGSNLGSEDTATPFSTIWNTTSASNGTHTLSAVARDSAGNTTTSSSITVTVTGGISTLLGNTNLENGSDTNSSGEAEAFKYTATGSGTTGSLKFYVDTATTATTLKVGVYSNSSGHPGTLLTSGTISSPSKGAWNTITLSPAVSITSGTVYWIAFFGTGGSLAYRDQASGSCSEGTSTTSLTSLPSTWASGTAYNTCGTSAYVVAASSGSTTKVGDFNGDNVVNIYDMGIFLSKWLSTTAGTQDLNGDGVVNIYDLGVFLSHYGT